MAKPKLTWKSKLSPLSWVTVRGIGKLKKDKDPESTDSNDYNYCATITIDKASADAYKKIFDKFWRENKPSGVGKQKYDVVKEEFIKVMDDDGKPVLDADDEPLKEATGQWLIMAKTMTQWPDGKPNVIKLLGSNGQALIDGHPLESGCGEGTMGILHCSVGINGFNDNEGLQIYLNGVQIKDSSYAEFTGGGAEVNADEIEDNVAPTDVIEDDVPQV